MKTKLRINVANRLYMGFAAVCVGVLIISLGSLVSMTAIQTRIDIIVNEVAPAEKALARLQTESMNLSRLVSLYFNERDVQELVELKSEYHASRSLYLDFESQLLDRISQFSELASVYSELKTMSEDVSTLLSTIETSMISYEGSLKATQSIDEKRTSLIELNKELELSLNLFVQDTFDPNAKELAYEAKSLIERGGGLALQISFASNLVDFQDTQELFRTFLDDYGLLGFRMLGFARSDEFFERSMQDVTELTSVLIETMTLEGGIGPIQNEYLQLRASLNIRLSEIQETITSKVEAVNKIAAQVSALSETASEEAKISRGKARLTIIVVTAVVIVLSILIGFLVAQSVRRPLNTLRSFINHVGQGDLRSSIGKYSNDEIGDISRAMDELVSQLRNVVLEIAEQSEAVSSVARKTNELADLTTTKSQQQQQEVELSVHSIGEMSSSIKEVAHTAEHTSQQMQAGETEAKSIQTNISVTVSSVSELNEKMQGAVNVIQELDDGVSSIESILETIQNIAEQTNLLALNAAIEAARAGEQGRGFAVVADEVRTLATRTQQSTEEIREKISSVQAQSKTAVDSIVQSQGSTTELTQTAQAAGEDFDRFVAEIRTLSEANMSIAAAAEEQSMTTEQMSQLMQTINELSTETTGIIQEVSEGILSLNSVSQDLNKAVHQFKT